MLIHGMGVTLGVVGSAGLQPGRDSALADQFAALLLARQVLRQPRPVLPRAVHLDACRHKWPNRSEPLHVYTFAFSQHEIYVQGRVSSPLTFFVLLLRLLEISRSFS